MRYTVPVLALACAFTFAADNAVIAPRAATSLKPQAPSLGTEAITIPQMLSYQGKLTDTLGQPVPDGNYQFTFRLYTVPSGGSAFWTEGQTILVRDGLFSALLGAVTPITSVPDGGTLYLGLQVAVDPELDPRLRIASSAYAYKADTANYAHASGGGDNAWVRQAAPNDSILWTVNNLGIARGGSSNKLHGNEAFTHVNLGIACTTGQSGQSHTYATVGGGYLNTARGYGATVGGGASNRATGTASTIPGGSQDTAGGVYSTVGGGRGNIAGNATTDTAATVAGGQGNRAVGQWSFVGGGKTNVASESRAIVGGGEGNTASDWFATVGGGYVNTASGAYATVGGGWANSASGRLSAIPGGAYCTTATAASASFAAGRRAVALHRGSFVWGDSSTANRVASSADNEWTVRSAGGVRFYSNSGLTSGVQLAAGGNSWSSICDSANKADFRPVDRQALLENLAAMPVHNYRMKAQDDGTRHIGPVAQDFHAAFGYGENDVTINNMDAIGVSLAAIQALYEQNQALSRRVAALEARFVTRD